MRSAVDPLNPERLGFAHRGLHCSAIPENSLAAFRAAARADCGAECDVRLSHDGVPIVFHDPDLTRLCGSPACVERSDSGDLANQCLAGTEQMIPTLRQVLELWPPHLPLLIECKTEAGNARKLAHAVAGEIDEASRWAAIGIMSFDPLISGELREAAPDLRRGLVVDADWPDDFRLHVLEIADSQFLAIDRRLGSSPWTAEMRRRMPVYAWTIRNQVDRAALGNQVDALIWEGDGRP